LTCPSCGHPIAGPNFRAARGCAGIGCGTVAVIFGAFFVWAIAEGNKDTEAENAHPTCISDYRLCADNADVINHYRPKNGYSMNAACQSAAESTAKFGTPTFPWLSFGGFYGGRSYIEGGTAILVEDDAKFANGFGAMMNVIVKCSYDLATNRATVEIDPK
jgi:hypothetical protein